MKRFPVFHTLTLSSFLLGAPLLWAAPPYNENFETSPKTPDGWTSSGQVSVDTAEGHRSKKSLVLQKTADHAKEAATATGPSFAVTPERWDFQYAFRSELTSQDNSYNGELAIEVLDQSGKSIERITLADPFRQTPWRSQSKQIRFPKNAATARFTAKINKETPGKFWIDELSAIRSPRQPQGALERMQFTTAQLGNLLYPDDPKTVTIEVWASEKLSEAQTKVRCEVRDYWGAEQGPAREVELKEKTTRDDIIVYEGVADLSDLPIDLGRYYEFHGSIATQDGEPFANHTSFAVLPEAAANSYKPEEVPFTARTWDATVPAAQYLTRRIGIRIAGVWINWDRNPPYNAHSPTLDLVGKLGMGFIGGIQPNWAVEHRSKGYEKVTEEMLRGGVQSFMEKYGHIKPIVINLGNEPHNTGEEIKKDIAAYRAVYTEFKKIDPSVMVVSTSVGPEEEYFKAGLGEWCDAYDFHTYESAQDIRYILEVKYPALFKKYGNAKPIWATETGLNSQGMARHAVAAEVFRKFANFFAAGGANICWFSMLYPDPDAKLVEDFATAHNVFDSRYAKYAPKMDAIALYNAVNAIGAKKFAEEKTYNGDIRAFLFRDRDNLSAQFWYKERGREDVFIPLAGISEVEVIRVDGTRGKLSPGEKGITITVNEDPFVLLYKSDAANSLPSALEKPAVSIVSAPESIVQGGSAEIALSGADSDNVKLVGPPGWKIARDGAKFTISTPPETAARKAEMIVKVTDAKGATVGELYCRPDVTALLSLQILPVPANTPDDIKIRLRVRNNSDSVQKAKWDTGFVGEQHLVNGRFTPLSPTQSIFKEAVEGAIEVAPKETKDITLSLDKVDLTTVYRVRATLQDATGRTIITERPVGGFYAVRRAAKPVTIDGVLDETDWKSAPIRTIDRKDEFFSFSPPGKPKPDWKGPEDLSAGIRYLWDDKYLYVAVDVRDDIFAGKKPSDSLWAQDGLQFLIDPSRTSEAKAGKYDYFMGEGKDGQKVWCVLSADGSAPTGEVKEIQMKMSKGAEGTGNITYELAIPWSRVAPFKPAAEANLGFTMIVNEDDGNGRDSFMTWFGDAHNKDIDKVGDLILQP